MGQSLGVPVWKLLGGRFRERVPAYANAWYQAEREPTTIAALATAVVARGYRALKLDPFGAASAELSPGIAGAPSRSWPRCATPSARRADPDRDARPLHAGDGVAMAALLEPYDPEWIEEPVPPENPNALRARARGDAPADRNR